MIVQNLNIQVARLYFSTVFAFSVFYVIFQSTVCQTKLDLAIVVDTSGSVGFNNFKKVQNFLKSLVDFFNIGRDETHIALVSYSYSVSKQHLSLFFLVTLN